MWSDLGAVTGELAANSENVVDLIERKYQVNLMPYTTASDTLSTLFQLMDNLKLYLKCLPSTLTIP